ncbi:hypothetical protein GCM10010433_35620 [Streptomyces pulveraceus]
MGASGWDRAVPYQEDLVWAFDALRRKAFEERDYYWGPGGDWRRRRNGCRGRAP